MYTSIIDKTALSRPLTKKALNKNVKSKGSIDLEEIPFATIRLTMHALRWVFLLVFLYLFVSIIIVLWQGGTESITQILVYSITGFFTFFMGYFGWVLAQGTIEMITGKEPDKKHGLSYYLHRKHNKYKS